MRSIQVLHGQPFMYNYAVGSFQLTSSSKTFQAVKDNLTDLTRRQDQQELQAIISWLSPLQFRAQQSDIISRRQK